MRTPLFFITALSFCSTNGNAIGVWWNTLGPITKLESTLVTPTYPVKPLSSGQVQFVWPGMEPADQGAVLQNVINSQSGNWSFYPEYCCEYETTPQRRTIPRMNSSPNQFLQGGLPVYPGDLITNTFTFDVASGAWIDGASITRGSLGVAAAEAPFQGSFHFDPSKYPASTSYQMAYLVIELQQGAQWDWGKVIFQNVTIEAETTNTTWCTVPKADPHTSNWLLSKPVISEGSETTTCFISQVEMDGP